MPLILKITDYGSPQIVAKHMEESGLLASDMMEPMARIALDMMRITGINFSSGGRRGGGSWKRLAPSTIERKGHDTILVDTGALKASVTEAGAPFQILDFDKEGLNFGTDRPWAFVHQYGRVDKTIVARPFLRFIDSDETKWNNWLLEYLTKPFDKPSSEAVL
jgi:phage gpG-like protein